MEWILSSRGKNNWYRGSWYVEFGDRKKKNPMFASRGIWYTKGVLEIYLNTYWDVRMDARVSAGRIGRSLQELFGTQGRWICDVTKGKAFKDYVQHTVAWYARCPERPDIKKMEEVVQRIRDASVEQAYVAMVKSTGETEYWLDSELPGTEQQKCMIRKYAENPPEKPNIIKGRYWRYSTAFERKNV